MGGEDSLLPLELLDLGQVLHRLGVERSYASADHRTEAEAKGLLQPFGSGETQEDA